MFINDGGFRFREVAERGGFSGNDYTYVAKFFDLNDDGRRDLITINDYGVNRAYLNGGNGRFEETQFADLTDNGQSMGLSIADFDSDGELELYVSNMYSYAGNRIVPLARQVLKADTYNTLLDSQVATRSTSVRTVATVMLPQRWACQSEMGLGSSCLRCRQRW